MAKRRLHRWKPGWSRPGCCWSRSPCGGCGPCGFAGGRLLTDLPPRLTGRAASVATMQTGRRSDVAGSRQWRPTRGDASTPSGSPLARASGRPIGSSTTSTRRRALVASTWHRSSGRCAGQACGCGWIAPGVPMPRSAPTRRPCARAGPCPSRSVTRNGPPGSGRRTTRPWPVGSAPTVNRSFACGRPGPTQSCQHFRPPWRGRRRSNETLGQPRRRRRNLPRVARLARRANAVAHDRPVNIASATQHASFTAARQKGQG
jgi:hypothetical protein